MYVISRYPKVANRMTIPGEFWFVGFIEEDDVVVFCREKRELLSQSQGVCGLYMFSEGSMTALKSALTKRMISDSTFQRLNHKSSEAPGQDIPAIRKAGGGNLVGKWPFKEYRVGTSRFEMFKWIYNVCQSKGFFITDDLYVWFVRKRKNKKKYRRYRKYKEILLEYKKKCRLDDIVKYKDKPDPDIRKFILSMESIAKARMAEIHGRIREDIPNRQLIKHCVRDNGTEIKNRFELTDEAHIMYFHMMKNEEAEYDE